MYRKVFYLVVGILIAFASYAKGQGQGTSDVALKSVNGINLIISIKDDWQRLNIDSSVNFIDLLQFLKENQIYLSSDQIENLTSTYILDLMAVAQTDGKAFALIQQMPRLIFKEATGKSIEEYINDEGYQVTTGNNRPVGFKKSSVSEDTTFLDIIYLVEKDPLVNVDFFEINIYATNDTWVNEAFFLTQLAVSLRIDTEQVDSKFQQRLANYLGLKLKIATSTPKPEPTRRGVED